MTDTRPEPRPASHPASNQASHSASTAAPPAAEATDLQPPPWLDEAPPLDEEPPWGQGDDQQSIEDWFDSDPATHPGPAVDPIASMDWTALAAAVTGCQACRLSQGRNRTVFGVGDPQAALMLIGEGPGQEEDRQGEPFVGRAGQLLNRMLAAIGLTREQVYIANIVKCRPPNNRNPQPDEANACAAYLARQIALVQPQLIVALGGVAASNLLRTTDKVGQLRGRLHQYRPADGGPALALLVTYHPSYYLRSPAEKARGWQDLQRIVQILGTAPRTGMQTGAQAAAQTGGD